VGLREVVVRGLLEVTWHSRLLVCRMMVRSEVRGRWGNLLVGRHSRVKEAWGRGGGNSRGWGVVRVGH
jgi:hypothetical protein